MKYKSFSFLFLLIGFWACNPSEEPSSPTPQSDEVKEAIYESMEEWYYWNEELPSIPEFSSVSSNEEFLEAIKFKPLDRFSYLTTIQSFQNAFVGRNAGHGFGFAFDSEERLYLTFVFSESPAGKDGWERGWEILEINGKAIADYKTSSGGYDFQLGSSDPGITNLFTFKLPDGNIITRANTKAEYQSNSVLYKNAFDVAGKKVGYWVYQSFKATAGLSPTKSREVDEAMSYFESENIEELILDLRYNGGGSVAVAEQINNYLIQSSNSGKLMYTNQLNALKSSFNDSENFSKLGNLNLSRIIFITSRGTASASELVINCLNPYVDIVLIGDNTYGKPVGSFPLSSYNNVLKRNEVELVPITFALANSEGKAEYFEGFPATYSVGDSPQFPWGDSRDLRFAAAIDYIENGGVSARIQHQFFRAHWEMIDGMKGVQQEFPAY